MPETVLVVIQGNAQQYFKEMQKAGVATDKFAGKTKKTGGGLRQLRMGFIMVAGAIAGVIAGINKLIKAYGEQEEQEKLLRTALRNRLETEEEVNATTERMIQLAKERQKVTPFGDEESIAALKIAGTFPLAADEMEQLLIRAQDFAAATGKDLVAAMADLGRATEGQFGMLSRYGVSLREVTKETGDFDMLMQDLDSNFRGFAETAGKTTLGALKRFQNLVGDFMEELGAQLAPLMVEVLPVVLDLIKALLPPLIDILKKVLPFIKRLLELITPFLGRILEMLMPIVEEVLDVIMPPLLRMIEVILPMLLKWFEMLMPLLELIAPILELIFTVLEPIILLLSKLVELIMPILGPAIEHLALGLEQIVGFLTKIVRKLFEFLGIAKQVEEVKFDTGEMFGPFRPEPTERRPPTAPEIARGEGGIPTRLAGLEPGAEMPPLHGFPEIIRDIATAVKSELLPVNERIIEFARALREMGVEFESFIIGIGQTINEVFGAGFRAVMDDFLGKMQVTFDEGTSLVTRFFGSIWNALLNLVKKIVTSALVQIAVQLVASLAGIPVPGGFGGLSFLFKALGVPLGRQFGGGVRGRFPYLVGERGPELFVPHGAGDVLTGARMDEFLGRMTAAMTMRPAMAPAGALGGSIVIEEREHGLFNALFKAYQRLPDQQKRKFARDVYDAQDKEDRV